MIPFCGCNDCVAGRLEQASDSNEQTASAEYNLTGERWPVDPRLPGQGSTVTWSMAAANYAADYIQFDGFITNAQFISVIRAAFEAWEKVTNIDFVEVADSSNVDVRLGWGDLGGPGGTIGTAYWSYSGDTITQSFIEFDRAENWTYNIGPASSGVGAYQVALHEIGHVMGIAHSGVHPSIMYPSLINSLPGLTQDDVSAARAIYGTPSAGAPGEPDPGEPDDPVEPDVPSDPGGIFGTSGRDVLIGTQANDRIYALAADDIIRTSGGSDTVDGGAGHDTMVYSSQRSAVQVDLQGNGEILVRKAGGGTDTLVDVERIDLTNGDYIYDIGGANLGFAYRIYHAAFGRTPDEDGLRFWTGVLDNLDRQGWSEQARQQYVAKEFNGSDEFSGLFGTNPGARDYIDAMYDNVLDRQPDSAGYQFWVDGMQAGLSQEDVLIAFSESDENVQNNVEFLSDGVWVV